LSSEKQESQNRYLLVSGGFDRQLILWEINSDNENPQVNKLCSVNEGQRILSVACHPTELIIASAGHDRIIILWKIEKNEKNEYVFKKIKILKGHKRAVESIVFTPDCKRLISCGQDQTIRFWDVEVDKNKEISKINISLHTIELGKPYQGMNISGVKNLDPAQISVLEELGASRD
jgi:WD40 repeat protein